SSLNPIVSRLAGLCPILSHDLLYSSHGSTFQADLDTMWMGRGFCKNILDNPLCHFAGTLILFQDDQHCHAWLDGGTSLSIHIFSIAYGSRTLPGALLRHVQSDLIGRKNRGFCVITENGFHNPENPDVILLCKTAILRQHVVVQGIDNDQRKALIFHIVAKFFQIWHVI